MKILFISLISCCVSVILFSCGTENTEKEIPQSEVVESSEIVLTEAQYKKSNMELAPLSDHDFSDYVLATGLIDIPPEGRFEVSAYFGGKIIKFDLLKGQKIVKGQTLFVLENPTFVQMQEDYLDAKSQLAFLTSDFERQKLLSNENITSQKSFTKSEADYNSTIAKVESLRKKLEMLNIPTKNLAPSGITSKVTIKAPISGYIESINVNQGAFLNPTDIALTIMNTEHMHIELSVFEQNASSLKKEQSVTFFLPDNPAVTFEAEIFLLAPSINENRVLNVHAHLKDEHTTHNLVPGMFVEAKIEMEKTNHAALPNAAIVNANEINCVLSLARKDGDKYYLKKNEVTISFQDDEMAAITFETAPKEGTLFLTKGGFQLIK